MDMDVDVGLTWTEQQQQESGWLDRKDICALAGFADIFIQP